jgi:hypothetical protein
MHTFSTSLLESGSYVLYFVPLPPYLPRRPAQEALSMH